MSVEFGFGLGAKKRMAGVRGSVRNTEAASARAEPAAVSAVQLGCTLVAASALGLGAVSALAAACTLGVGAAASRIGR